MQVRLSFIARKARDGTETTLARLLRFFIVGAICLSAMSWSAPGPSRAKAAQKPTPAEIAKKIKEELSKAKAEQYLLLLRDCIVQAQALELPPQKNPFHQVLISALSEDQPMQLRTAVVKALTIPVAGSQPYLPGAMLLLDYVGSGPEAFRRTVREGLELLVPQVGKEFCKKLEELVLDLNSERTKVEDAAYLLWACNPIRAVEVLIEGLRRREKIGADVAPYHWVLSDLLHHREKDSAGWERYFKAQRGAVAFREDLFTKRRIEEELFTFWRGLEGLLQEQAATEKGVRSIWPFLQKCLDSPWKSVRKGACKVLGFIGQKYCSSGITKALRPLLERQASALIQLLGAGQAPRYEPLDIRLSALSALRNFGEVLNGGEKLLPYVSEIISSDRFEKAFRVETLKTAADLDLRGVRPSLCDLIISSAKKKEIECEIVSEAVRTLGKLGLGDGDTLSPAKRRQVVNAVIELYRRVEEASSAGAVALRQAAISSLGKIGRGAETPGVTQFLREVLQKALGRKEGADLAFYSIYALGELGEPATIPDLVGILAKRASYPPALAKAAVDAIWLIGSSGKKEAASEAIEALAPYLGVQESELSDRILQKLINLCRSSVRRVSLVALKLQELKNYKAVLAVIHSEEIRKVMQVASLEGPREDFEAFWAAEHVYLESLEKTEDFAKASEEIRHLQKLLSELKRGPGFDSISKRQAQLLSDILARVQSKERFLRMLDQGEVKKLSEFLKSVALKEKAELPWFMGKLKRSTSFKEVFKILLKDPKVAELFKPFGGQESKEVPPKSSSRKKAP